MEILLLCNQTDAVAFSLYKRLACMGINAQIVTAEELQFALWTHELDRHANGQTEIKLQDNRVIYSKELKVVWNRIRYFPMDYFKNETDRYYAQNEMAALYISFLKNINKALTFPVNTNSLSIPEENLIYLKYEAIKAGLPVLNYYFTTSPRWQSPKNMIPLLPDKKSISSFNKKAVHLVWQNHPVTFSEKVSELKSAWIAGNEIFGDTILLQNNSLQKLSQNLKKDLVEVQFSKTNEGYKVSFIDSFPAYAPDEVIDSLANQFTKKIVQTK